MPVTAMAPTSDQFNTQTLCELTNFTEDQPSPNGVLVPCTTVKNAIKMTFRTTDKTKCLQFLWNSLNQGQKPTKSTYEMTE